MRDGGGRHGLPLPWTGRCLLLTSLDLAQPPVEVADRFPLAHDPERHIVLLPQPKLVGLDPKHSKLCGRRLVLGRGL